MHDDRPMIDDESIYTEPGAGMIRAQIKGFLMKSGVPAQTAIAIADQMTGEVAGWLHLYREFQKADTAWSEALEAAWGPQGGAEARATIYGRGQEGTPLRAAWIERENKHRLLIATGFTH